MRALLLLALVGCAAGRPPVGPRCKPGQSCWPDDAEWQALARSLKGKLLRPESPLEPCRVDAGSPACAAIRNPWFLQDQPGGTESVGWLGAWTAATSPFAVAAEAPADISQAVTFARRHHLRLVVKGTGHDYLGRSSAPDSLLIWTHQLRRITMHDAFVPGGCPAATAGTPAVSIEAGARWLEAYQEVTVKHGRYVQGGGCTSVGAAGGFIQGGGFGSWSKKYGTGAANVLEAEVVTADGKLLLANACQNQDLFWALRGGGGGTFGIVTRVTLRTHALPDFFGVVAGRISASSDDAFHELLERFVDFYGKSLSNEHWGEQVTVHGDNSLELSLVFQGMSARAAEKEWQPFRAWIDAHPDRFKMNAAFLDIPGDKMWNAAYIDEHIPGAIRHDDRPDAPPERFFWNGDASQVSVTWYAYQSRWIPQDMFEGAQIKRLAEALFAASRQWSVSIHFNKGQAGAAPDAVQRGRETSMNPAVFRAAALVIIAAAGDGLRPDEHVGEAQRARVTAAMDVLRKITPGAGSYVNETDYFEPDWQQTFWGENYTRLLAIKRKYDPEGIFTCHHCVGASTVCRKFVGPQEPPGPPERLNRQDATDAKEPERPDYSQAVWRLMASWRFVSLL